MLKKVLLVVAIAVLGFAAYAGLQPATFTVERSLDIDAPSSALYAELADFHNWRHWSPWDELDPTMNRTYGGSEAGTGATYAWAGNEAVGRGRMEITDVRPDEEVVIALTFEEPFPSDNVTRFRLEPSEEGTRVTVRHDGAERKP